MGLIVLKYNTILFDLDGTLTESGIGITRSVAYAYEKLGLPVPEKAVLDRFVGPPPQLHPSRAPGTGRAAV